MDTMETTGLLAQLEGPLGGVMDWSHNGIVVVDRRGDILVYNRAARRIFGDRGAAPVGRHFSEVRPEAWPDIRSILETGRPQIGRRIVLPQTTIIANRNPIRQGREVVGVFSVFQDISEYEAIISELQGYKRLHREMEAIFENSQDGLYITDGAAVTIRVNRAYEAVTGLDRRDLIGRNMEDLVAEGVFDHSVTLEVLKTGTRVNLMQNVMHGKEVMVTGTPIRDESGEIVLVLTNVRDMTELNSLKTQLDRSRSLHSRMAQSLQEQAAFDHALKDMVVKSEAMASVVRRAVKVAGVASPVLIYGESGVGKSMLAQIIHRMGPRKDQPFVKINCGTIPASLMESELFGYVKGAFTGAAPEGKAGLIEAAHGGCVFLDEVGELTLAMQVKLLQVIEEKTFNRVGSTRPQSVDVAIVAATNRDLDALRAEGGFRDDLFYRLNVIPISIPPLRERREDIPPLALHVLEKYNLRRETPKRLSPEVLDQLMQYPYPGNVRELINIMERMLVLSEGEVIGWEDLPRDLRAAQAQDPLPGGLGLKASLEAVEARLIAQALERNQSVAAAARELGVHVTTLWRKMARHGLESQ